MANLDPKTFQSLKWMEHLLNLYLMSIDGMSELEPLGITFTIGQFG